MHPLCNLDSVKLQKITRFEDYYKEANIYTSVTFLLCLRFPCIIGVSKKTKPIHTYRYRFFSIDSGVTADKPMIR